MPTHGLGGSAGRSMEAEVKAGSLHGQGERFDVLGKKREADPGNDRTCEARLYRRRRPGLPDVAGGERHRRGDGVLDDRKTGQIGNQRRRLSADHRTGVGASVKQSGKREESEINGRRYCPAGKDHHADQRDGGGNQHLEPGQYARLQRHEAAGKRCSDERSRHQEAAGNEGGCDPDGDDEGEMVDADHGVADAGKKAVPEGHRRLTAERMVCRSWQRKAGQQQRRAGKDGEKRHGRFAAAEAGHETEGHGRGPEVVFQCHNHLLPSKGLPSMPCIPARRGQCSTTSDLKADLPPAIGVIGRLGLDFARRRCHAPAEPNHTTNRASVPTLIDKRVHSLTEAVADIKDGATVLVSGFGGAGSPIDLLHALLDQGAKDLTLVSNNAGNGHVGMAALIEAGRVRKIVCSFPRSSQSQVFTETYRAGRIELEVVPQGTLAERIRAGGAGIPAFYTPTSAGTPLEEGKEVREFDGRRCVLEPAIIADVALVKAKAADRWGNLIYHKSARNFGPIMCTAAKCAIVQVREFVELGDFNPEHIVTPGIYVDRAVLVEKPLDEEELLKAGERRKPR